jgi:alpha-beta hydrolase superfamily lysophospholipase
MKGELFVTKEDAEVVISQLDMTNVLSSIPSQVPILLLHGTDDELISVDDAHSYKNARKSVDLTIIEGARHAFRGKKQLKQLITTVTDWIDIKYKTRF